MKKLMSIILVCVYVLSECIASRSYSSSAIAEAVASDMQAVDEGKNDRQSIGEEIDIAIIEKASLNESITTASNPMPDAPIKGLDDTFLLQYVEDSVYSSLIHQLNSENFFIENVEAIYYPKEYIEALAFNSQQNRYFGYTAKELDTQFHGIKYIFTMGDDGRTIVVPMETVSDDIYVKAMEDVLIGSGVILICVTVSLIAAPAAPAVGMIFTASASNGTAFALKSGAISFAAAAIIKGYETESFDQAIRAGVAAAGEGFKWGAITGIVVGGASKWKSLYGAAKQTNFTINQYARIQQETGYPLDVIKEFHNMKEYQAFRNANLKSIMVGNKSALVKTNIDFYRLDSKGRTNLQRMRKGLAPLDSNGVSYELHHVGQRKNGTLAILTQTEHDNPAIHGFLERTEAHATGTNWDIERQSFWKAFAALVG